MACNKVILYPAKGEHPGRNKDEENIFEALTDTFKIQGKWEEYQWAIL